MEELVSIIKQAESCCYRLSGERIIAQRAIVYPALKATRCNISIEL